jgi:hypothetical protein
VNERKTKIRICWDSQCPGNEGWYVEVRSGDMTLTDSVKITFPVEVGNRHKFPRGDRGLHRLARAVAMEYPESIITLYPKGEPPREWR